MDTTWRRSATRPVSFSTERPKEKFYVRSSVTRRQEIEEQVVSSLAAIRRQRAAGAERSPREPRLVADTGNQNIGIRGRVCALSWSPAWDCCYEWDRRAGSDDGRLRDWRGRRSHCSQLHVRGDR